MEGLDGIKEGQFECTANVQLILGDGCERSSKTTKRDSKIRLTDCSFHKYYTVLEVLYNYPSRGQLNQELLCDSTRLAIFIHATATVTVGYHCDKPNHIRTNE